MFFQGAGKFFTKFKSRGVTSHYFNTVKINVNKYALGRPGNPGSFKIPYDEKQETISDIKMDGTVSPRLIEAMDDGLFNGF
jgi:hypothetical protein